jgi:type III restriction enzyme
MKLARLLTNDEIDEDALTKAKDVIISVLNAEHQRVKDTERFREIVEERGQVEIEAVNWEVGAAASRAGDVVKVDIASENVEDLFEATGRKLNEGLHKVWWRERVAADPAARDRAKLELFALCIDPDLVRKVEDVSRETVQKWLNGYAGEIKKLEEGSRAAYGEVRNLAENPELDPIVYPAAIQGRQAETTWKKHLYVDKGGQYPAKLYGSEEDVLNEEIARKEVVAWLRNVDRKAWALCVPYEVDGEFRAMYPDFLVLRSENGNLVVDIIEPHTISLADAPAKAAGLAKFAAQHADKFGRIELILIDGKAEKRLELTDETVRNKVKAVKLIEQLRQLF